MNTRQKIADVLSTIFGWGIYIVLVAGGLAFFGFLIAFIMGGGKGSAAEGLAVAIQKQYFPLVIKTGTAVIAVGLIAMFVGKQQALSLISEKKAAKEELDAIKGKTLSN
jgi:uncharacterized integral membrane protein